MSATISLQTATTASKHIKAKICLVGNFAVGKTSLVRRYVQDLFSDTYIMTLGTKVSKKSLHVGVGETIVDLDLMIWDIMGQPGFRDLLRDAYFSMAKGVLAVCDWTRKDTLEDLPKWIHALEDVAGKVPIVMAVNKADRIDEAKFGEDDARAVAENLGAPLSFVSAKSGAKVEELFQRLGRSLVDTLGK